VVRAGREEDDPAPLDVQLAAEGDDGARVRGVKIDPGSATQIRSLLAPYSRTSARPSARLMATIRSQAAASSSSTAPRWKSGGRPAAAFIRASE